MSATSTCPHCHTPLLPSAAGGVVRCPRCATSVIAASTGRVVPVAPRAAVPQPPPVPPPLPSSSPGLGRLYVVAGATAVVLLGLTAALLLLLRSTASEPVAASGPAQPAADPPKAPSEAGPSAEAPRADAAYRLPPDQQRRVDRAIDRGVALLREGLLAADRSDFRPDFHSGIERVGPRALAGLTLLSCDVPPGDEAVRRVAEEVRAASGKLSSTYALSTCLMFLDRLGDPADADRIRALALRLVAGQTTSGGWGYQCRVLSSVDEGRLANLLRESHARVVEGEDPAALPALRGFGRNGESGDNSNTQFAVLSLWTAKKHGVPVTAALARAAARFRKSQNRDGTWGYSPGDRARPDSMTCAALVGLAVGRGLDLKGESAADWRDDAVIRRGLEHLGRAIGKPARRTTPGKGPIIGAESLGDFYFLWSLERVAVIFDLPKFGEHEWYRWGAGLLTPVQNEDGSWGDQWGPLPDTCFALLFLKRANVAADLTSKLKAGGDKL